MGYKALRSGMAEAQKQGWEGSWGDLPLPPARCGVGTSMALPRWGLKPPEEVIFQTCLPSGSRQEN